MRTIGLAGVAALAAAMTAGCGRSPPDSTVANPPAASAQAQAAAQALPATPSAAPAAPGTAVLAGRTRELVNPDQTAMVFLYFDLAGVAPPIDQWVENDSRVDNAAPIDKAARRASVRAELAAGLAAVHGVGHLRLSLSNARLSDYDPSYGEFTVGALAPSSQVVFDARRQHVTLQFANGLAAQRWQVPAPQAQAVRDRVRQQTVTLDAELTITGVQPAGDGGAIVADVDAYELHLRDGTTLARVRVAKP
jgi:hypothetical protein